MKLSCRICEIFVKTKKSSFFSLFFQKAGCKIKMKEKRRIEIMEDFFGKFVAFIMAMVKYIQDLVGYFRAKNDGLNPEQPEFPSVG